ncbi:glycosyltransferase family 2 protein [Candidatus Bipolaricaulota bacterium]
MTADKPKVSIIIPSFNRRTYLCKTLPSYLAQEHVSEIIIVDDGSTDDYSDLVDHFALESTKRATSLVCLRHEQRKGAPAARNSGIEASTGDLLLFSDDDVVLSGDFVSKAAAKIFTSDADIVGARLISVADHRSIGRIESYYTTRTEVFNRLTLSGRYFVDTGQDVEVPFVSAVGVWKRWIFDKGVRFDETYGGNGYREETSAQVDASMLGARIIFVPKLVAWHIRAERTGGQWRGSVVWWYIWAIRNNIKFLRKNYAYLKCRWDLKHPWWISLLAFSLRVASVLVPEPTKRILRRVFEVMRWEQRRN